MNVDHLSYLIEECAFTYNVNLNFENLSEV